MFRRYLQMAAVAAMVWAAPARAEDYLLYWQVDDSAEITWFDGTGLGTVTSYQNRDGQSINAARAVSSTAEDGLYIYYMGDGAQDYTMEFTGNGSTGPLFSYIGAFDSPCGLAELSFAIELGNWKNGEWTTLATTGMISYNDLTVLGQAEGGAYILTPDQGLNVPAFMTWNPASYNVPEPSSGLMMLIGAGLLALRRRRR